MIRFANIRNGLVYPHDDVCCFQSCHAHHLSCGYFRMDAMPYRGVIHLLLGGKIEIIDATQHNKVLSDALKYGVPTWCRVFNRAIGGSYNEYHVCSWETKEIRQAANSQYQRPLVQTYRKLIDIYGVKRPAIIGENVILTCYNNVKFDDKPEKIKEFLNENH